MGHVFLLYNVYYISSNMQDNSICRCQHDKRHPKPSNPESSNAQ